MAQQLSIFDFSDSDKSGNEGDGFPDDYVPNSVQSQDSTDDLNVNHDVYSPASSSRSKGNNDIDQLINRLQSEGNSSITASTPEQNNQHNESLPYSNSVYDESQDIPYTETNHSNQSIRTGSTSTQGNGLDEIENTQTEENEEIQQEYSQEYSQYSESNEPEIVFHMPSQNIGGTVYGSYDMNPDLVESYDLENESEVTQRIGNSVVDYVDDLILNEGQSETNSHDSTSRTISSTPMIPNILDDIEDLSQDERSSQSTGAASSSTSSTRNVLRTIGNHPNDIEVSSQTSSRPSTSRSNTPLQNSLLDYFDDLSDIGEENNPPVSQSSSRSGTPLENNYEFDQNLDDPGFDSGEDGSENNISDNDSFVSHINDNDDENDLSVDLDNLFGKHGTGDELYDVLNKDPEWTSPNFEDIHVRQFSERTGPDLPGFL